MAFNPDVKRKIVRRKIVRNKEDEHLPCVMCGVTYPLPDAVHIIDEKEWKERVGCDRQVNGIPLCPNCHRVFDEVLDHTCFVLFSPLAQQAFQRAGKQTTSSRLPSRHWISAMNHRPNPSFSSDPACAGKFSLRLREARSLRPVADQESEFVSTD